MADSTTMHRFIAVIAAFATAQGQTIGQVTTVSATANTPASDLSTFVSALGTAGLTETLSEGTYTIFAPTNAAFDALPAGTLSNLLLPANRAELRVLLNYHVLPKRLMAGDLVATQEESTRAGLDVTITANFASATYPIGDMYLNGASRIESPNHELDNDDSIMHVINAVLTVPTSPSPPPAPPSPPPAPPSTALAEDAPECHLLTEKKECRDNGECSWRKPRAEGACGMKRFDCDARIEELEAEIAALKAAQ